MDFPHVSAPSAAGGCDWTRTFRRLWSRVQLAAEPVRLEYVFLVIALAWGVMQVFIVPPLQVSDEGDHWFRAWALTDGQLTADRQGMVTLPGVFARTVNLYEPFVVVRPGHKEGGGLPVSLEGQPGFTGYEDLFNSPGPSGTVRVASRVANYGPVGYLPQALGIGLGRLVGAPPLACFYLARLANLFAAIALLFFAIRLAPFGKQLFVLFALLPMTMFELASVACDALTIAGAMFFTSVVLWASWREMLRGTHVALVVSAAATLLNVKPGYWAMVLLVLLIRPAQLGGRTRYVAFVAVSVLAVVGFALIGFWLTATDARVQTVGDAQSQLMFILHEPLGFLGILWSAAESDGFLWALESIGLLGWLSIVLPPAFYLFVVEAALVFSIRLREEAGLQPWQRGLLAVVAVAVFLTLAVAVYAFLEPIGSRRVLLQGRYLVPLWLLLLLSVYGIPFARRLRRMPVLVGALLVMMVVNLHTLMSYYHPW